MSRVKAGWTRSVHCAHARVVQAHQCVGSNTPTKRRRTNTHAHTARYKHTHTHRYTWVSGGCHGAESPSSQSHTTSEVDHCPPLLAPCRRNTTTPPTTLHSCETAPRGSSCWVQNFKCTRRDRNRDRETVSSGDLIGLGRPDGLL